MQQSESVRTDSHIEEELEKVWKEFLAKFLEDELNVQMQTTTVFFYSAKFPNLQIALLLQL